MQGFPPNFIIGNAPLRKAVHNNAMTALELQNVPGEGLEGWDTHIAPLFNNQALRDAFNGNEVKLHLFIRASTRKLTGGAGTS